MNTKTKLSVSILVAFITLFGLFAVATPASAQYVVPECTAATLNGYIQTNGSTQVWFEWGQGTSLSYSTPKQIFSSDSNFSQRITGLTENTLYSYRAMSSRSYWPNSFFHNSFLQYITLYPYRFSLGYSQRTNCYSSSIRNSGSNELEFY